MENKKNLRNIILSMLIKTLENEQFSHIVINETFASEDLTVQDRSFINRTFSGTLEKLVYIDYILDRYSSVKVKKMKPVIRNILRMSVYQLRFMDSVPAYSCIDEAVKLARKRGFSNLTGFVNGILRKIQRETEDVNIPAYVKACAPEWFYGLMTEQYGGEAAEGFFRAVQGSDNETTVRLNISMDSAENIIKSLENDGCRVRRLEQTENACAISGFDSLTELDAFRKGRIIMQDAGSMMAVEIAAQGHPVNELTVDVCAAPGGKSLYMAEKYPAAHIIARDLTEYKINLIRENMARLGMKNIEPQVYDACVMDESLREKADIVIADLPCSGLGVIKRKPDILYRVRKSDLDSLQKLQRTILDTVQAYVKPGGILLFSTCTVNKGENAENTAWFTGKYDFTLEREEQLLPGRDSCDGFYIARMKKKL